MLSAVGLSDLLTETEDAYVAAAVACAADLPRRTALRQNLRRQFLSSPVCNEAEFATKFEGVLRSMWRTHCAAASRK